MAFSNSCGMRESRLMPIEAMFAREMQRLGCDQFHLQTRFGLQILKRLFGREGTVNGAGWQSKEKPNQNRRRAQAKSNHAFDHG